MRAFKGLFGTALAGLSAAALFAAAADARDLRYATGFPPASAGTRAQETFAAKVEELSGGDLSVQVFPQSLLSFPEMLSGVRDGVADVGFVLFAYYPAEFPSLNLVADMTMMWNLQETDQRAALAWAGALTEYIVFNCPTCLEEIKAQNQIYTGTTASPYMMLCANRRITTAADMAGVGLRSPGAHWSRWAESVGARSVGLPANETFEGLSQGVLDCTLSPTVDLIDLSLIDVVRYIVPEVPGGGFGATASANINANTWRSLTTEQREVILRASAYQSAYQSWDYRGLNIEALEQATARGIEILEVDPEFLEQTREFTRNDLVAIGETYKARYGLDHAPEAVTTMQEIYDRWLGLVAEVESTEDLADLIWDEVLSKVDLETYGL